jgi:predicted transcriptional regulator
VPQLFPEQLLELVKYFNMEKDKIINVIDDVSNKSNKDLFLTLEQLSNEFENTKQLIIDLTRHLESIEDSYNKVNKEIEKRTTT